MERATSAPPSGKPLVGNPWYSESNQREYVLRAARPLGLPEQSPVSEAAPLHDEGRRTMKCIGKGRGTGQAGEFLTPPSRKFADGTCETGPAVKQSDGMMPADPGEPSRSEAVRTMGRVRSGLAPEPPVDELQRAIERELVEQLREQNAALMTELEQLRKHQRNSPNSGFGSTSSWVEISGGGVGEERDSHGIDAGGCKTPRTGVASGSGDRFTPNGTKVPSGSPPKDQHSEIPEPPPPVPPLPMEAHEDVSTVLDRYEVSQQVSNGRFLNQSWKPTCEKGSEPTPGQARAFWLEQEVASLRNKLDNMVNGSSFQGSSYWNGSFAVEGRPPSKHGLVTTVSELPVALDRPEPGEVERIIREHPEDQPRSDQFQRGRACTSSEDLGDLFLQARAGAATGARPPEYPSHLLGGCGETDLRDRACTFGNGPKVSQGHSLGGCGEVHHQDRASALSMGPHSECLGGTVPHHDRASHGPAANLLDKDPGNAWAHPRHGLGGGGAGDGCQDRVYGPWTGSEGGPMNTKTELPDLPETSSPLQFGDWLHLSTPSMKDISGVAGWWWESP